jgi:hypothetical protein
MTTIIPIIDTSASSTVIAAVATVEVSIVHFFFVYVLVFLYLAAL